MKRKYCAHSYINEENVFFVQSLHKLNYHKLAIYTCSPKGTDPEMKMKLPQGENSNTFPFIVNMVCNEKISTVTGCEGRLGGSVCTVRKYGLQQKKLLRVFPLPHLGRWRLGEVHTIKPIYTLHSLSQDLNWLQIT